MSTTSLYVRNLPFNISLEQLQQLFKPFGPQAVYFAQGRYFAYVDVQESKARAAVQALDGFVLGAHVLAVKQADFTELRTSRE
jgi:RNA recognition motif-containing protein